MYAVPKVDTLGLPGAGATPDVSPRAGSVSARLRAEYAREVAALPQPAQSVPGALVDLGGHVALGVGAALACHALMAAAPVAGWALYPLVALFIATRFRAVGNMLHEASHGILVRGKRNNRRLGQLLAVLDFTSLETYAREHFTHHLHLGHPEKDLDFVPRQRFGFADATRPFVRDHLLRPLLLVQLPSFVRPLVFHRQDSGWVRVGRLAYVAGLLALAHWGVGWRAFCLFFLLPWGVLYQVVRYWSDAMDHAGIIGAPDEFHRARNHIFAWGWLNRLLFPREDQYHLTHHLFPAVPTAHQGRVHQLLLLDADYAARDHSVAALLS
ncbi:fatty acid desaturase [Corallococcus sp. M34]|uniref:fatty acid desaturase n=1 Tax=Citreicoccus inhibens TaxID=2849499 RepID=UPI001C2277E4|nr:fatty acid desaturase [Citreicoccus inhibens]MBU8894133.1 fatty acid desaturase [Citreicoccus inhibens]